MLYKKYLKRKRKNVKLLKYFAQTLRSELINFNLVTFSCLQKKTAMRSSFEKLSFYMRRQLLKRKSQIERYRKKKGFFASVTLFTFDAISMETQSIKKVEKSNEEEKQEKKISIPSNGNYSPTNIGPKNRNNIVAGLNR